MRCPKCKNPVENNAAVCGWCGADCAKSKKIEHQNENPKDGLNAELVKILSKLSSYKFIYGITKKEVVRGSGVFTESRDLAEDIEIFENAILHYKRTTAKSYEESLRYIQRLNFFRVHKFATEEAWEAECIRVEEWEAEYKRIKDAEAERKQIKDAQAAEDRRIARRNNAIYTCSIAISLIIMSLAFGWGCISCMAGCGI